MDVAAAFPSVARECLVKKMRLMGVDKRLVGWTANFMTDRKVRMRVDGQTGEEFDVAAGLPQGPTVTPILRVRCQCISRRMAFLARTVNLWRLAV